MSVKILGVVGSPRKRSNSEVLVKEALEGSKLIPDTETELVLLCDKKIRFCKGCYEICQHGKVKKPCPNQDDMEELLTKLLEADGYIFGSPTYMGGVPGLMRAFMDRTVPIYHKLRGKVAGIIVVGDAQFGSQELVAQSIRTFCMSHQIISQEWPVCAVAAWPREISKDKRVLQMAKEKGQNVAKLAAKLYQ